MKQQELTDYLVILARRWPWVLVPTLLLGALAWLYSTSQPLTYEATARVLLDTTAAQDAVADQINVDTDVASRDLVNEINFAESDPMRQEVSDRLQIRVEDLAEGEITPDVDSDILNFQFSQPSATRAALIANTWAEAYVDLRRDMARSSIDAVVLQLETELLELRTERNSIRERLESLEDALVSATGPNERATLQLRIDREASAISGELRLVDAQIETTVENITQLRLGSELAGAAQILQVAAPPQEPVNAPVSRDVAIGAFLGLIVGSALGLGRDTLDKSIRDAEAVQGLGLTVLGEVPKAPRQLAKKGLETISHTMPGTVYADSYQKVRSAVRFVSIDKDVKTILVTSPHEGDGKTTLSVNLATAYASVGTHVVLLDLDLRRPSIQDVFSAPTVPGFTDAVEDGIPLDQLAVSVRSLTNTLRVLTAGTCPPDPAAYLASPKFASAVDQIRSGVDLVLFDAPPTLPVADALSVAPLVDGVILVVSAGRTKEDELIEAVQGIRRAGGEILGVVVNRTAKKKEGAYNKAADTRQFPAGHSDFETVKTLDMLGRPAAGSSVIQLGKLEPATAPNPRPAAEPTPAPQAEPAPVPAIERSVPAPGPGGETTSTASGTSADSEPRPDLSPPRMVFDDEWRAAPPKENDDAESVAGDGEGGESEDEHPSAPEKKTPSKMNGNGSGASTPADPDGLSLETERTMEIDRSEIDRLLDDLF